MEKELCGIMFTHNVDSMDYCYKEAIQSMKECCDFVIVVDADSTDETQFELVKLSDSKLLIITTDKWNDVHGKEKLSYFTNLAIEEAERRGYEYILSVQADEIVHEKSYKAIREAIKLGHDGYMVKRVNLWASPYLQLDVPANRMPCSPYITRLAKSCYRAYDDAESLRVMPSFDFVEDIRIYHMGFVRKRDIHPKKIRFMQGEVFQMGVDPKLGDSEIFNPYSWFTKEELKPIDEPLPLLIQDWAKERYYND